MRPTKFTPELLDAFRSVLADEWAALAFTEEELVWQANRRLPQADRISYRTYLRYKADILFNETQDLLPDVSSPPSHGIERLAKEGLGVVEEANAQLVQEMHDTLKEALFVQKKALVRGVCEGQTNWRRFAWMLERKFPDFRLKPLSEALGSKQKPNRETEKEKAQKEGEEAEQAEREKREARVAKMEAEKAAQQERLKDPYYKWSHRGYLPWAPFNKGANYSIRPHELKALEEALARDVAAGYQCPYAHLGYRPDPVERTDGIYIIIGMGEHRLPLRVHVYRFADEPTREEREELWLKQEQERRNIIRAEQGLPPENLPEPDEDTPAPSEPIRRGRGVIYGMSGG